MKGEDDLRAVYQAVVGYHNDLVAMRFTVAGLYFAASGFLAAAVFAGGPSFGSRMAAPILGIVLAFVALILEIRTYSLLENLGELGYKIESNFDVGTNLRFFELMKHQPLPPRWPFVRRRLPDSPTARRLVSHSFGLNLLYIFTGLFWIAMLVFGGRADSGPQSFVS